MTGFYVPVYPFPFGTKVFMHKNGVIREAEYRGMIVKDTSVCGCNVVTEHVFWLGNKLGEEKITVRNRIYKTVEDAAKEINPVSCNCLDMQSFSQKYLSHFMWNGIQFSGWLWDGSRPVQRAPRESLKACEIYMGKLTFIDYPGNMYDAEHFQRFYQTAEMCRKDHTPSIAMLDDEDEENFAEKKREEFYEYVAHHCPGFEDKIDWMYFQNLDTMPNNLAEQVRVWTK